MKTKKVEIKVEQGIHARRAAYITKISNRYNCSIYFRRNDLQVNAKSIIGIMMLALAKACIVEVTTDGVDEEIALEEISQILVSNFPNEEML